MKKNDQELLEQVILGDRKAFKALFNKYYKLLCVLAFSIVNDYDDAEELVQDLFVKLWEKRREIAIKSSLKGYLVSAVKNSARNHLSFLQVREDYKTSGIHATLFNATTQEQVFADPLLKERIHKVIDDLPPRCGLIFKMCKIQGFKYKEIAGELNISVKTVEKQMGKALRILNDQLKDYLPIIFIVLHQF